MADGCKSKLFSPFSYTDLFVQKLEYDNGPSPSESVDEYFTPKSSRGQDRRQHQRMWTLSEVVNLVDGISEYGVGRWTDIKRCLFSSSSYRTPIDLRVLH